MPVVMRPLALPIMMFLLSGLIFFHGLAGGESAWTEEPWDDGPVLSCQNASIMSDLLPLNLTENGPKTVRLAGSDINISDYLSRDRQNELWVSDNGTWTRYLLGTQGDEMELVAYAPAGGFADLYRISYASGNISHRGYDILQGHYIFDMIFCDPGRTMLVFSVDNQPANAVIIDILPREAESLQGPVAVESLLPEKARILIQTDGAKDYDVFVDGAFYSSDIGDGVSDGMSSFTLSGDEMHTIVISKRDSLGKTTYKSEHKRYFKSGYTYTLKA